MPEQCGTSTASSTRNSGLHTALTVVQARVAYRTMNSAEEIFERIEQRRQRLGMSANAVGPAAGMSRDALRTMRRAIAEGRQHGVSSTTLVRLAPVLRTTVEWLTTGEGVEDIGISKETLLSDPVEDEPLPSVIPFPSGEESSVEAAGVGAPRLTAMPRDVPVLGTAAGSIIRKVEGFALEHEIVDYVRRPPALENRRDVYALYISGISMEPMHGHGDLRFIDPKNRPQIGDSVIVLTRTHDSDPGQAYIKILARRTQSATVLRQLNPEAMIEIPNKFIIQTHRVMTMNDLFGV